MDVNFPRAHALEPIKIDDLEFVITEIENEAAIKKRAINIIN